MAKINCRDNRKKSSKTSNNCIPAKNAERERSRVRLLRNAFQLLQSCLPSVPPDTKLSKLDILILATNYITNLMQTLNNHNEDNNNNDNLNDGVNHHQLSLSSEGNYQCNTLIATNLDSAKKSNQPQQHQLESLSSSIKVYRPIKKWPMRSRLYSMIHFYNNNINNGNNADNDKFDKL